MSALYRAVGGFFGGMVEAGFYYALGTAADIKGVAAALPQDEHTRAALAILDPIPKKDTLAIAPTTGDVHTGIAEAIIATASPGISLRDLAIEEVSRAVKVIAGNCVREVASSVGSAATKTLVHRTLEGTLPGKALVMYEDSVKESEETTRAIRGGIVTDCVATAIARSAGGITTTTIRSGVVALVYGEDHRSMLEDPRYEEIFDWHTEESGWYQKRTLRIGVLALPVILPNGQRLMLAGLCIAAEELAEWSTKRVIRELLRSTICVIPGAGILSAADKVITVVERVNNMRRFFRGIF